MSKTKFLQTLYKKTATGAIQQWAIGVEASTIVTIYGQVGGKIQTTRDLVKSGKNQGRKNETGAEEQALKEATAQWLKKKKAGYVENSDDAEYGKTDDVIEGGVLPMLAKVFEEHQSKIIYPVAVQPKLDGHRCIAVISGDNVSLWTRTRKRINSVPHIEEKLKIMAKKMKISAAILDGELYDHELKNDFENLTSAIRKQDPSEDSKRIQYHIYDVVGDEGFQERFMMKMSNIIILGGSTIELVDTKIAENLSDVENYLKRFLEDGYEGLMVRSLDRPYEHKRSDQLLKMKKFEESEFLITGVEEGRGKLQGHGIFVCVTNEFIEFRVKMSGPTAKLKEYWENKKEYIGHNLTVQYQGRTSDGVPRFPVGIRIREDL